MVWNQLQGLIPHNRLNTPSISNHLFQRGSDTTLIPAPAAQGTYTDIPEFVGTFVLIKNTPVEIRWRSGTIDVTLYPTNGEWHTECTSKGVTSTLAVSQSLNRCLWFAKEYMAYDRTYQPVERGDTGGSEEPDSADVFETVPQKEQKIPFYRFLESPHDGKSD